MRAMLTTGCAVLVCVLSACSSGSGGEMARGSKSPSDPPASSSSEAKESPNPVAILRRIQGCKLPPGSVSGSQDVNGDRMASCQIADPEGGADSTSAQDVTIYTNSDIQALKENTKQLAADDENARIEGSNFVIGVTGVLDLDSGGVRYFIAPARIAAQVGGKLIANK